MSLWLPRQSPIILARASLRHSRVLRPHTVPNALVLQACARSRPDFLPFHRSHSSKATATSNASVSTSVPADPSTASESKPSPPVTTEAAKGPLLDRAWKRVKHEAAHYWHGSKLLVSEVRISARLQWKILHGESLTRRERRQVRVCVQRRLMSTSCRMLADFIAANGFALESVAFL
jgi:LETM1 and EF-hand domain-containing protein 1